MPCIKRRFVLITFLAAAFGAAPASTSIPPKTMTLIKSDASLADVMAELRRQTGFAVNTPVLSGQNPYPASFEQTPFWNVVEQIASKTNSQIVLSNRGREITLEKSTGPRAPSSVTGAFRVAVRQVQTRIEFDTGKSFAEVTLDVHWEPRFPVFRIDSEPKIETITDDKSSPLTPITTKSRTRPDGYLYTTKVRIEGVTREAKKIVRLAGVLNVTATERMLPFKFDLGTMGRVSPHEQMGVKAALNRFAKSDDHWVAELELAYPSGQPVFESFESWLTENRARLVGPDNTKVVDASDYDIPTQGQRVVAIYRFPANALTSLKGWTLIYDTPAPLMEFPIRFDLKNIPLP